MWGNRLGDTGSTIEILSLLMDASQTSVRRRNGNGKLPLHLAAEYSSEIVCLTLVDAYPESACITCNEGRLPIHYTCQEGKVDTVKYLLEEYPASVDVRASFGRLPIHLAAMRPARTTTEALIPIE